MSALGSKNTDAIISAALELFKSQGYSSVTVSDICRKAGVPRSSFYSIFSGKDEIITHVLGSLKGDQQSMIADFLNADSDLDRIWALYDRYLTLAMDFGPELTGALLSLELQKPVGLFELYNSFNEWFAKLIFNCQKQGIIRNKNKPEDIVALGIRIAIGAAYEWCLSGGAFNLRDVAISEHETLYDVPPEYRKGKARTN